MDINVEPIHFEGLNCFEDNILSIISWIGRNYELIFSESWGFGFDINSDDNMANRIFTDSGDFFELIDRFCNIRVISRQINSIQDAINIFNHETNRKLPIIIKIDSFWCPWDRGYKQYNHSHFCIVENIDFKSEYLLCTDAWYRKRDLTLPFKNLYNGCRECITFIIDEKEDTQFNFIESVSLTLNKLCNSNNIKCINSFEAIRSLSYSFANKFDFEFEFQKYTDMWLSPLYNKITAISNCRFKYGKFLEYILNNNGVALKDIIIKFYSLGSKWKKINSLLVKAFYTQERFNILRRIPETINEIADIEENLSLSLADVINNSVHTSVQDRIARPLIIREIATFNTNNENIIIDLSLYYNNKGLSNVVSIDCTADLTGTGQYFLVDKQLQSSVFNKNISYKTLDIDGKRDNISCSGQTINIPCGTYRSIMLLGCAEWGDFCDNMIVHYENGDYSIIEVKFTDWSKIPQFGECEFLTGKCVEKRHGQVNIMNRVVRLFAKYYLLSEQNNIKCLVLPECSNIHIFAITLCGNY